MAQADPGASVQQRPAGTSPLDYGGDFGSSSSMFRVRRRLRPRFWQRTAPVMFFPPAFVQGSPFPGNTIPSCMISPNATALLNAGIFPAPTSGDQFTWRRTSPTNVKEEIVRIDHNFSSKFSVFGHFYC